MSKKKSKEINLETHENGNTKYQNVWHAVKAILREQFIVINAYIKKKERSQLNNLTLHLKRLKSEE